MPEQNGLSRRGFLTTSGAAAFGAALPASARAGQATGRAQFADLLREPDLVTIRTDQDTGSRMQRAGDRWMAESVHVRFQHDAGKLSVYLQAPHVALTHVMLRWNMPAPDSLQVLGDAWERSYGELAWGPMVPEKPLPWYFLTFDGEATHGYGVETGAGSFAFWLRDNAGVSLWLDVRNGGEGVQLGERELHAATVITREGHAGETSFAAACAFCQALCPAPRRAAGPFFGSNDWYYAYGKNTEAGILRDASLMSELAPAGGPKAFCVVDDGYQDPARFPDLPGLAAKIAARGARPGLWVRPLRAPRTAQANLLLPAARFGEEHDSPAYDPTEPEALELALKPVREANSWGFELIKHDFTTYELLGQWGSAMGASPTLPGWHFSDRTRINAEIVRALYQGIRQAASERLVLSCNAVGHLGAGLFEMQRTGDDVSGLLWERTRRTGVNTLGMRLPQHGAFFINDADCVPITPDVSWTMTRRWLDAVAASGTLLLVSPDPRSMGPEQKQAVRAAFALAASLRTPAVPQDWMSTRTPEHWLRDGQTTAYGWLTETGADPFSI